MRGGGLSDFLSDRPSVADARGMLASPGRGPDTGAAGAVAGELLSPGGPRGNGRFLSPGAAAYRSHASIVREDRARADMEAARAEAAVTLARVRELDTEILLAELERMTQDVRLFSLCAQSWPGSSDMAPDSCDLRPVLRDLGHRVSECFSHIASLQGEAERRRSAAELAEAREAAAAARASADSRAAAAAAAARVQLAAAEAKADDQVAEARAEAQRKVDAATAESALLRAKLQEAERRTAAAESGCAPRPPARRVLCRYNCPFASAEQLQHALPNAACPLLSLTLILFAAALQAQGGRGAREVPGSTFSRYCRSDVALQGAPRGGRIVSSPFHFLSSSSL